MFVPEGGRRARWRRCLRVAPVAGRGTVPTASGLGRPSQNHSIGLAWTRRVGLTRLETTGLVDGGTFPAQHMAGDDRGPSTGQVRPSCAVGVLPGWERVPLASIVWSSCGLGAANLLGPLIPGQLVV